MVRHAPLSPSLPPFVIHIISSEPTSIGIKGQVSPLPSSSSDHLLFYERCSMFYERLKRGNNENVSKLPNFNFLLESFDRIKTTIMILNKFNFLKVSKLKQFLIESI